MIRIIAYFNTRVEEIINKFEQVSMMEIIEWSS